MVYVIQNNSCFGNGTYSSCAFTYINGGVLTGMSIFGLILNTMELHILRLYMNMSPTQKIFLKNVSSCDLLMALVGLFRGLGIMSPIFLKPGSHDEANAFCTIYAILMNVVTSECMLVLLPLTIDRFMAIVVPLRHRYLMTKQRSKILVIFMWSVPIFLLFYDIITYLIGQKKFVYNTKYHRCVSSDKMESAVVNVVGVIVPIVLIPLMYSVVLYHIQTHTVACRRLLITCSAIVVASWLAYLPSSLTSIFHISLSYEVSMVLTVTMYYSNSVINPIIYFVLNPKTMRVIKHLWNPDLRLSETSGWEMTTRHPRVSSICPSMPSPRISRVTDAKIASCRPDDVPSQSKFLAVSNGYEVHNNET